MRGTGAAHITIEAQRCALYRLLWVCVIVLAFLGERGRCAIATYSYEGPPVRFGLREWVGIPLEVTAPPGQIGFDSIVGLRVFLEVNGGNNLDTIVRLQAPGENAPSLYLINRPGYGYWDGWVTWFDNGFVVEISDEASRDIHLYYRYPHRTDRRDRLIGTWQPDGRDVAPGSSWSEYREAERLTLSQVFGGINPIGTWYLWVADWSAFGSTPTLNNWVLEIAAVPEPVHLALGVFVAIVSVVSLVKRSFLKRIFHLWLVLRTTRLG